MYETLHQIGQLRWKILRYNYYLLLRMACFNMDELVYSNKVGGNTILGLQ